MVSTCMVPRCSASARKTHKVSFHRLPKALDLCKKWLRAINNPKFGEDTAIEALKNLTVCSLHFKPEDFEPNPLGVKRPALVKTAVPSILPDEVDEQPGTSGTACSAKRICLELSKSPPALPSPEPTAVTKRLVAPGNTAESLQSPPQASVKDNRSTPFLRPGRVDLLEVTVQVSCLLQLFDRCLGCGGYSCWVRTRRKGVVFHVMQQCFTCDLTMQWASHTAADRSHTHKEDSQQVDEEDEWTEEETDNRDLEEEDDQENLKRKRRDRDEDWMLENPDSVHTTSSSEEEDEGDDDDYEEEEEDDDDEDEDEDDDDVIEEEPVRELCTECGKLFRRRFDKPHVCLPKAKPVTCSICGKGCLSARGVRIHMERVHQRRPRCKFCFKKFRHAEEKLQHEQSHQGETLRFRCPECPERFPNYKRQRTHIRTHSYTCQYCDKAFKRLCALQRHTFIHTGKKPFTCAVCDRYFNQESHLKSHMRLHTGERPFKCQQCDRSFNHNVSLKSHLQRYHGAKTTDAAEQGQENHLQTGSAEQAQEHASEHHRPNTDSASRTGPGEPPSDRLS
ncbi:zinc finger protein 436-like [Engraulis encrasicolus]|uniref:zinc finger protein 436-like n=1 Tax=Engraulis encrasicolus TaxID=184585 RepID=UPI002FD2B0AE